MNEVNEYVLQFVKEFENSEFREIASEEFGIDNFPEFYPILEMEISNTAMDNYLSSNTPMLTYEQLATCLAKAATQYHLSALQDAGLISAFYDETSNDIVYQLTNAQPEENITSSIANFQSINWN